MNALSKISNSIDNLNSFIGKICSFLFIPMIFITAYEVFMRYFLKSPTIWAWELNMQIWAFIVMLTGGFALLKNQHVKVDVIYNMFSVKKKAVLNIITCICIMVCMAIIIVYGFNLGMESLLKNERQPTLWASPMFTIRLLVPIGGVLLFLQCLSELIKNILFIAGKERK